jgi:hypothetical protein
MSSRIAIDTATAVKKRAFVCITGISNDIARRSDLQGFEYLGPECRCRLPERRQ